MSLKHRTTIWQELESWADELPRWQRFVLTHSVNHGRLSDEELADAYVLFMHDNCLADDDTKKVDEVEIPQFKAPSPAPENDSFQIISLSDLRNINAVPNSSILAFGAALTVIYGHNAAGKSGFARVISDACFSRSRPRILPNVYTERHEGPLSARFAVRRGGESDTVVEHIIGDERPPDMLRVAVFDSQAARSHLTDSNPLGFRPLGFDVFPELIRVQGEIKARLSKEMSQRNKPNQFINSFIDDSPVRAVVQNLGDKTDLDQLRRIGTFGAEEKQKINNVDLELQDLKLKSKAQTEKDLSDTIQDLQTLERRIIDVIGALDSEARNLLANQCQQLTEARKLLSIHGADQFRTDIIQSVGSPAWERFIASSRVLASEESEEYPEKEDRCLFCHQSLSDAALNLIQRYWKFLESESKVIAEKAERAVGESLQVLNGLDFSFFGPESRLRTGLEKVDSELANIIHSFLRKLSSDRAEILEALKQPGLDFPQYDESDVVGRLQSLLVILKERLNKIRSSSKAKLIRDLDAKHVELRHRQVLNKLVGQMEHYVRDRKWIQLAKDVALPALNTKSISTKENQLFGIIIEGQYQQRLEEECEKLDCVIPFELQTQGRKGQTLKTLKVADRVPDEILSEGEQRALALADFLTETNMNPASAASVFDDPVTSLDHLRKRHIAVRLAGEALVRQTVVFTHDVVFLNMLLEEAERLGVAVTKHWIQRKEEQPGHVVVGDVPATSREWRTTSKAKKTLEEASKLSGSDQVEKVRTGIGQLRRILEELVLFRLFRQVVQRWEERIMIGNLRKINWSDELADKICGLYDELSGFIEGHIQSDQCLGRAPVIGDLERLIAEVECVAEQMKPERKS